MVTLAPPAPTRVAPPRPVEAAPQPRPSVTAPPPRRFAPPRSRTLVLIGAVSVALISTASAYLAMVGFGIDVLGMAIATAYATAGVFELSLMTVALLAREAAKENRPGGTLLTLTWALSSASGVFAAWHEAYIDHPLGAAVFRFVVPLLAALMWHLALIGDRHLATGHTWSEVRAALRVHAMLQAVERERRARLLDGGSHIAGWRVQVAESRRLRARAVVLRTVQPERVRSVMAACTDALAAVDEGTASILALHDAGVARMAAITAPQPAPAFEAVPPRPATPRPVPARPAGQVAPDAAPKPRPEMAAKPAPVQPTARLTAAEKEAKRPRVMELLGRGVPHRDIETETGVPKSTVGRWAQAARQA